MKIWQGGSHLKETFDVKLRLEVICCLDFTEVECVFLAVLRL